MINWDEVYEYRDGQLINKARRMGAPHGQPAGSTNARGYVSVFYQYKQYRAHRVIWEMHNGPIPEGYEIDHINRDRADNRIENLRLVTRSQNHHNKDEVGFSWDSGRGKYRVRPRLNGRRFSLGSFDNVIDARAAYLKWKRENVIYE